jgi:2',3'-cyclic-nucleotide 2'-phosphodiesterase/3'-nucleotidase/5'-nucleotidase
MNHKRLLLVSVLSLFLFALSACIAPIQPEGGTEEELEPATSLTLRALGTYDSGEFDAEAAEIVAFDSASARAFIVNGGAKTIDILDLSDPTAPMLQNQIDMTTLGAGANSVAIRDGLVAVAIENEDRQANGLVAFFDIDGALLGQVEVGPLPDMVTFTPDGSKVLTANEGEPSDDYAVDPEGSVAIIDISNGIEGLDQEAVTIADFRAFNDAELDSSVRIFGPNATVAQDLEPEYIAVAPDSGTAFVTLQENNAVAVVDLATGQVAAVVGLGFKDHSLAGNMLDASDEDGAINLANWPTLGMYQPDAIVAYEVNDELYLITANEGDARDYGGYSEEARVEDLTLDPNAYPDAETLQAEENLGRLKTTLANGDIDGDGDVDQIYSFGARSFSIWDSAGNLIYDSGDEIARITAERFPDGFNASGENDTFDERSDDKGSEPEALALAEFDGRTYAFLGLERIGGIMIYDVSEPAAPVFVEYVNTRDFAAMAEEAGDLAPEGIAFVSAEESPTGVALLIVANEFSGTTTVYEVVSGM